MNLLPSKKKLLQERLVCLFLRLDSVQHIHQFGLHIAEKVKRTEHCPVLLLLDGHDIHFQNVDFIVSQKNHVMIVSLSHHCSY